MLSELESMREIHFGQIRIAKPPTELMFNDAGQVDGALYRAGLKARKFERMKIERMPALNDIETARMEWAAPITFSPEWMMLYGTSSTNGS